MSPNISTTEFPVRQGDGNLSSERVLDLNAEVGRNQGDPAQSISNQDVSTTLDNVPESILAKLPLDILLCNARSPP